MATNRSSTTPDSSRTLNPEIRERGNQYRPALTDMGNARRFAELFSRTVRYVPTRGWFLFSQTHWQPVDRDTMLALARQSLDELRKSASQLADEETQLHERLLKHVERCESLPRLQALVRLARTLPEMVLAHTALDADPYLLNLRNGTLNLRSGDLLAHNPQHYLTRLVPYDYSPEATSSVWEDFLERLTGSDSALKRYLQRAVGSTLFGASNESTAFVLTGSGQRAHQVFLATLRHLLGSYSTHTLSLKERTLSPTLLTSRLLTSSVPALVRAFDPSILFAFLNHEPLTIIKASTELIFEPHTTLWLSAPELAQFSSELGFFRDYLQPIPLALSLSSYEAAQLSSQLQQVLPAILNWAIEGFQLWYTEAPPAEPACLQPASAAFYKDQDSIALFLAQSCTSEPDSTIPAQELYRAYVTWAHASGERVLSASHFGSRVLASGLQRTRQASGYSYCELKLLSSTPSVEENQQPLGQLALPPAAKG